MNKRIEICKIYFVFMDCITSTYSFNSDNIKTIKWLEIWLEKAFTKMEIKIFFDSFTSQSF